MENKGKARSISQPVNLSELLEIKLHTICQWANVLTSVELGLHHHTFWEVYNWCVFIWTILLLLQKILSQFF